MLVENQLYITEHGQRPAWPAEPCRGKRMEAKSLKNCIEALWRRVLHYQICEKDKVSFLLFNHIYQLTLDITVNVWLTDLYFRG